MSEPRPAPDPATRYRERFRPQLHYSPAQHWVNDPNGLVFAGGVYHLFYQHNPGGSLPGSLSWGHAVSPDLTHWTEQPVALPARETHMIFSGSVVTDVEHRSGLGDGLTPPLVALYTGHTDEHPARQHLPQRHYEAQYLAYSTDQGATWRYGGEEAVLDLGRADFRDPKVFWDEARARWVMALVHPNEREVGFYASPDLHRWTPLSTFGPAGETSGIWEVPDFFALRDDPGRERWVLKVDHNPGGPNGGSGAQYWVGDWDGAVFTPLTAARPLEYGKDCYAALSFNDLPAGADGSSRRVWLAWMNNWQYATELPTDPWRGHFTVPRELSLGPDLNLRQRPVHELETLREGAQSLDWCADQDAPDLALEPGRAAELCAQAVLGVGERLTLIFLSERGPEVTLTFSEEDVALWRPVPTPDIPGFGGTHRTPLPPLDGPLDLHLLLDTGCIEVFVAGGLVVLTDLLLPGAEINRLRISAIGAGSALTGTLYGLRSIWAALQ